jgi:hypothetical protein
VRILFCHQSVGADLLEGLRELGDATLTLAGTDALPERDPGSPLLATARVGRNGEPASKWQAFAGLLATHGGRVDFALMKLCYVDILDLASVDRVFGDYQDAMRAISARHPQLRLGHVTVPLRARPQGVGASVRRLLGQRDTEHARNRARAAFNERLRLAYGSGALFDLARIESTAPGARPAAWREGGHEVPALAPEYSRDGGHLNSLGRRVAARAFLGFLMQTPAHASH